MKKQQKIFKMKAKPQKTQQEYSTDEIKVNEVETVINEIKQRKLSIIQLEELNEFISNEINDQKIQSLKSKGSIIQPKPNIMKDLPDDDIIEEIKRRKISTLKLEELANRPKPEFEELPNEVLQKIFSYLDPGKLFLCGQLSKRIRAICHDKSLWQKVNLYGKKVSAEFINFILDNGCNHLELTFSEMKGCLNIKRPLQLKYLKLEFLEVDEGVLEELLGS